MFSPRSNSAFSMVEVLVAAAIFSIAVVGIYASLASVREQSRAISDKSLGAALCAQQFLESRRAAVDMRDWNSASSMLNPGTGSGLTCTQTIVLANGTSVPTTYTMNYAITDSGNYARKASVTVTWP